MTKLESNWIILFFQRHGPNSRLRDYENSTNISWELLIRDEAYQSSRPQSNGDRRRESSRNCCCWGCGKNVNNAGGAAKGHTTHTHAKTPNVPNDSITNQCVYMCTCAPRRPTFSLGYVCSCVCVCLRRRRRSASCMYLDLGVQINIYISIYGTIIIRLRVSHTHTSHMCNIKYRRGSVNEC